MDFLHDDDVDAQGETRDVNANINSDVEVNDAQDIRNEVAGEVIGHNTNAELSVSGEKRKLSKLMFHTLLRNDDS